MKLLVVEDDIVLNRQLGKILRSEGFMVDLAFDGEEGLYFIKNFQYDAILLDVMLPIRSGWELLDEVRLKGNTPVMMLTARDAVSDRVKGLDSGADDYLTKPFEIDELLARVRSLLRRFVGGVTVSRVKVGAVELDQTKKRVEVDGKPVEMTAGLFGLLELLILNNGKVLSRDYLYEHLGDENSEVFSNSVDAQICKLRKLVGKDFIKTRRGLGYIVDQKQGSG